MGEHPDVCEKEIEITDAFQASGTSPTKGKEELKGVKSLQISRNGTQ